MKYRVVRINDYVSVLLRLDVPAYSWDAHVILYNCVDSVDFTGYFDDCKEMLHDVLHAARYYDRGNSI